MRDSRFSPICIKASSSSRSLITSLSLTSVSFKHSPSLMICSTPMPQLSSASRASFSPASIRFAISTSPSRVSSEMRPISFKYILTGSEIRDVESGRSKEAALFSSCLTRSFLALLRFSIFFLVFSSMTMISSSSNIIIRSSICSSEEMISSDRSSFSCSKVT